MTSTSPNNIPSSTSPAAKAAWDKFEQCLSSHGLTFNDVKEADAAARIDMIASLGGGLPSAPLEEGAPSDIISNKENSFVAPVLSGIEMALISSRWNALSPVGANGTFAGSSSSGGNGSSPGNAQFTENVQTSLPFLDPTHGRSLLHQGTSELLEDLKANLDIGNSAPALAIASELIHRDPIPLLRVLHSYSPHLSLNQLQDILGLKVGSSEASLAESGIGLNQHNSFSGATGLKVTGSAPKGSGTRRLQPTLNDIPLKVGAVLTQAALASQFGAGFRATYGANGRTLHLPHCVQEGDTITVLRSNEVLR